MVYTTKPATNAPSFVLYGQIDDDCDQIVCDVMYDQLQYLADGLHGPSCQVHT